MSGAIKWRIDASTPPLAMAPRRTRVALCLSASNGLSGNAVMAGLRKRATVIVTLNWRIISIKWYKKTRWLVGVMDWRSGVRSVLRGLAPVHPPSLGDFELRVG
ncbi:MAG: hypothetical protein HC860_24230 [Alkalinema sp. RU_4_3]|nr:hypothetical protein [Alkalinema sp. RU_4_3]